LTRLKRPTLPEWVQGLLFPLRPEGPARPLVGVGEAHGLKVGAFQENGAPGPPVDYSSISALPVKASTVRGSRCGSDLTTDIPAAFIRSRRAF